MGDTNKPAGGKPAQTASIVTPPPQNQAAAFGLPVPGAGGAIIQASTQEMRALVAAVPRVVTEIRASIEETLKEFPKTAHRVRYLKPVGQNPDKCRKCGREEERARGSKRPPKECPGCKERDSMQDMGQKLVSDISVRAAEWMVQVLGGISVQETIEPTADENVVLVRCVVTDYHTASRSEDSRLVSRKMRGRDNSVWLIDEGRFAEMTIPAAQSRLRRNVCLRIVPLPIKQFVLDRADEITEDLLTPEVLERIVTAFDEEFGVSLDDLETFLQKKQANWRKPDRMQLHQVFSTLKQGENGVTVEEFFPFSGAAGKGEESPAAPGDAAAAPKDEKPAESSPSASEAPKGGAAGLMSGGRKTTAAKEQKPAEPAAAASTQAAAPAAQAGPAATDKPADKAAAKPAAASKPAASDKKPSIHQVPYGEFGKTIILDLQDLAPDASKADFDYIRQQIEFGLREAKLNPEEAGQIRQELQVRELKARSGGM